MTAPMVASVLMVISTDARIVLSKRRDADGAEDRGHEQTPNQERSHQGHRVNCRPVASISNRQSSMKRTGVPSSSS
jgi:hypothetical protein